MYSAHTCGAVLASIALSATAQAAGDGAFASRADAQAYLAATLPAATRANPKYLTKSEGYETIWLTQSILFSDAPGGAVQVAMDETFTQFRGGAETKGAHQARFSLADVEISAFTEPGDVTPSGEASTGVLFTCVQPRCVDAAWNGQASAADKTDISIQDPAVRARVIAAFVYLKSLGGAAKSPT